MNTDRDEQLERYKRLSAHRTELRTIQVDQINRFDRLVVTLSAGALGLSVTYFRETAGSFDQTSTWCLAIAWIAFVISVAATLGSHFSSQEDMALEINYLDSCISDNSEPGGSKNPWNRTTRFLNILAGMGFFAGAAALVCFAILTLF